MLPYATFLIRSNKHDHVIIKQQFIELLFLRKHRHLEGTVRKQDIDDGLQRCSLSRKRVKIGINKNPEEVLDNLIRKYVPIFNICALLIFAILR